MKKSSLVLMAAISLFSLQSKGQSQQVDVGSTTFGVRAGVNFQSINGKDALDHDLENKLKVGFNFGVNAEIPVAPDFYVQPGLLFTTKGAKSDDNDDTKMNLSYLELPINFLYKPTLGTGKLIVGFGPYLAYGLGGKLKNDDDEIDVKFKSKVKSGDDPDKLYLKPFDAGANFVAGYEFSNKFSAQLNAQLGLVKINPKYDGMPDGDAKWKNTGFGVSVGYRF